MNKWTGSSLGENYVSAVARAAKAEMAWGSVIEISEYPLASQDHITAPGGLEAMAELDEASLVLSELSKQMQGRTIRVEALDPKTQPIMKLRRRHGFFGNRFKEVERSTSQAGTFLGLITVDSFDPLLMFNKNGKYHHQAVVLNKRSAEPQVSIEVVD